MTDNSQGARPSSPFARSATQQETERTLFRSQGTPSTSRAADSGQGANRAGSATQTSTRGTAVNGAAVNGSASSASSASSATRPATATGPAKGVSARTGTTPRRSSATAPESDQTDAKTTSGGSAAATASTTKTSKTSTTSAAPAKRTRKARLRLARVDPWSVMKTAFLFSIAFGILSTVAMWVLWGVIESSGAFKSINDAVNDLLATPNSASSFDLGRYVTGERVVGFTALIAAADVVIFTALATLFSFLYNLSATVLGGLEVTLAED